jgi:bacterioferritin-associated ferredoxin
MDCRKARFHRARRWWCADGVTAGTPAEPFSQPATRAAQFAVRYLAASGARVASTRYTGIGRESQRMQQGHAEISVANANASHYSHCMIVCICHRISDRDIASAVQGGCASFDQLQDDLGVATACGACDDCARSTFSHHAGKACSTHHAGQACSTHHAGQARGAHAAGAHATAPGRTASRATMHVRRTTPQPAAA